MTINHITAKSWRSLLLACMVVLVLIMLPRSTIIAQGPPDQLLRERFKGAFVQIPQQDFHKSPQELPWKAFERDGYVEIQTTEVEKTMKYLMDDGVSLSGLKVRSSTLEDLFLDLTGRDLRG